MLSPGQYYSLVLMCMASASMSLICSGAVVIATWKAQTKSLYQTLIFGLSITDLVGSFATIFHPFMLPRHTREEGLLWASGNDATCTVAGFFLVSCYPLVSFFSMFLSAYFLAKVRYNASDKDLAEKYMRPGIAVAIFLCGSLAVLGSATRSFAPRVYTNVCNFGDCEVGKLDECEPESGMSWYLGWVQVGLFVLPSVAALTMTLCVYVTVRAKLNKGRRFVFGGGQQQQNSRNDKLVAVRNQALLYSFSYWNSFFWYFVYGVVGDGDSSMMEKQGEPFYFTIAVLVWLLVPLQGVVNFAVYTRPRYLQWRKEKLSRYMALRKAISVQPVSAIQHLRSTSVTKGSRRTTLRDSVARVFRGLSDETQLDATESPEHTSGHSHRVGLDETEAAETTWENDEEGSSERSLALP